MGLHPIWAKQQQQKFRPSVWFVDKIKFETQNLRRDTSFPSVIEDWRFVGGGIFVSIGKKRKISNIELFKKLPSLDFPDFDWFDTRVSVLFIYPTT